MTEQEYYTAPSDEVFEDIKQNAIKIWETYDDTYRYSSAKIAQVNQLHNVKDNAWYIVAMFDFENVTKLLWMVSPATRNLIISAMKTE